MYKPDLAPTNVVETRSGWKLMFIQTEEGVVLIGRFGYGFLSEWTDDLRHKTDNTLDIVKLFVVKSPKDIPLLFIDPDQCSLTLVEETPPAINDSTKDWYLANNGNFCPYCGSSDIYHFVFKSNKKQREVSCNKCQRQWNEIFELTSIEVLR